MSEYGRLWEQASVVRRTIKAYAPGLPTNTCAEARTAFELGGADVRRHEKEIGALLREWEALEARMAFEP